MRRVAAPYKVLPRMGAYGGVIILCRVGCRGRRPRRPVDVRVKIFVQTARADDIRPYRITLSEAKQPLSLGFANPAPLQGSLWRCDFVRGRL